MIRDQDPLWRRPGKSMAGRKRQEGCVRMTENPSQWPSKRGSISEIRPSDGYPRDAIPLAVGRWYDIHEHECHLGNVG